MQDVVVTGANGWIGGRVGSLLQERGLRVVGISRQPEQARKKRPEWRWIGTGPELEEAVEHAGSVDPVYRGPLNVVAPNPARHAEIVAAIGEVLGVPQTKIVLLERVAQMIGGAAEMVLASQRVVPRRAVAAGFEFRYPDLAGAIKQILSELDNGR